MARSGPARSTSCAGFPRHPGFLHREPRKLDRRPRSRVRQPTNPHPLSIAHRSRCFLFQTPPALISIPCILSACSYRNYPNRRMIPWQSRRSKPCRRDPAYESPSAFRHVSIALRIRTRSWRGRRVPTSGMLRAATPAGWRGLCLQYRERSHERPRRSRRRDRYWRPAPCQAPQPGLKLIGKKCHQNTFFAVTMSTTCSWIYPRLHRQDRRSCRSSRSGLRIPWRPTARIPRTGLLALSGHLPCERW